MVNIISVTRTRGRYSDSYYTTGMRYGFNDKEYSGLFKLGNTESDVKEKAARIYLSNNIDSIRKKYSKYSRKNSIKPINQ